tara:strand:- start:248 stop:379 length:132 start_codon:yes stop_codon:yes gene_type:complete
LIDTEGWGDDEIAGAQRVQKELGYFLQGKMVETAIQVDEYPEG